MKGPPNNNNNNNIYIYMEDANDYLLKSPYINNSITLDALDNPCSV